MYYICILYSLRYFEMTPLHHALVNVKKYKGKEDDYLPIHTFIDSTKTCHSDWRHRAILHTTFGIEMAVKVFGEYIVNSDNKKVPVRILVENHIKEDLGFLPTPSDFLNEMKLLPWMGGSKKIKRNNIVKIED